MRLIPVRNWRVARSEGGGLSVFFDPGIERVEIHPLTAKEKSEILDSQGSVSGLNENENPYVEEQMDLLSWKEILRD